MVDIVGDSTGSGATRGADGRDRPPATLSARALNRATLARQLLLARSTMDVPAAVEHLVGLQAQTPHTWYVGLWTRLAGFEPAHAADPLASRALVRTALLRSTIHLVTARDALAIRPLLEPVIERGLTGAFGKRLVGIDRAELVAAGRALLDERPLTFAELGRALAERWPDRDPAALAQAVRAWAPLVQVTPRGLWGRSGAAAHTTVERWLGADVAAEPSVTDLVRRYLGAFGPASVRDAQTWSGLTRLAEVFEEMRPALVVFRDTEGRELFDLPDAPRPDEDTPAPPRLLYDFDNLLLSHADRSRVITDRHRAQDFAPHGPQPRSVLLDGVTAGVWTTEIGKERAVLTVRCFDPVSGAHEEALAAEARDLLRFLVGDSVAREVRIAG
ncbi:winged helix DNA-binding domain-containing protein [Actinokineospora iranica]|uniref:Winged helix DNA-binding domain-containing protein n=1 Tax=Actinokineospora iranica TaxID=1271860 RepID=A0A1G6WP93_9PSEU|nr:winged helix DNA-binding domain-containing protein [Actinokineospora iranica]SDD67760.1 Winged helix DNA-binding domain-containing protein [Actinokineospora iranica]